MSYLLPNLQAATEIPMSTLTLICVMCGVCMYFIRSYLVIPALMVVIYPFFVLLSVAANYGLTLLEVFPLNKYDQWLICTITSATIGVIVGLCFVAGLARLLERSQADKSRFHKA